MQYPSKFVKRGGLWTPEHPGIRPYRYIDPIQQPPLPDVGRLPAVIPQSALTFVQKQSTSADATGTSLALTVTSTTAGALHVVYCKWEGAAGSTAGVNYTTNFTARTVYDSHTSSDLHGQYFYILSGDGGKTTVTFTLSATRPYRRIHFWEFTYTGTAAFDQEVNNFATSSTAVTSNNYTPTGSEIVCLGAYGEYTGTTTSGETINGTAADQVQRNTPAGSFTATWERIVAAGFTGAAAATGGTSWICQAISFNVTAGGGGRTTKNTRSWPLGVGIGMGWQMPSGNTH